MKKKSCMVPHIGANWLAYENSKWFFARLGALSALLLLVFGSPVAHAQDRLWNNANSGLWSTATNWDGSAIPDTSSESAVFGSHAINDGMVADLSGATVDLRDLKLNSANYSISNGTINLYGNVTRGAANSVTVNTGLVLQSGQHNFGGTVGEIQFNGPISGSGGIDAGFASPLFLNGSNTMTGDFRIGYAVVQIGSNASLGSGNFIVGNLTGTGNIPTISTASSNAQSITNKTYDRARRMDIGRLAGGTGTLTFTNDFYFDDTDVAPGDRVGYRDMWIYQTVVFQKGITNTSGTDGNKTLNLVGKNATTGSVAIFEGTSDRTGDTYIGTVDGIDMSVIARADNALGTGDIYMYAKPTGNDTNGLTLDGSLTGGITLSNNVTNVSTGQPMTFLISTSGNNTIAGRVKINAGNTAVYSRMDVTNGSLTISGGLAGASASATNLVKKTGDGILSLTGTSDQGVSGLLITEGTLRGVEGTAWSTNTTTGQSLAFEGNNTVGLTVLETSGIFTRSLSNTRGTVRWSTAAGEGSGGFAAYGGNLDIQLNNGNGSLTWASTGSFIRADARLILNSPTATHRVDFQNGINLNSAERTVDVFDNTSATADMARISGVISGTGSSALRKIGAGVLELTAANTYEGGTTVNAGTLLVNNASGSGTGTGAVTVNATATLGGSGVIAGKTTIKSGATLSPGNSPGNLSFGDDLTLNGAYKWELAALSTSNPGVNFDIITVTAGNVTLSGASMDLTLGAFAPTNVAFWQSNQTWTIINNTGAGSLTGSFAAIDNTPWSSLGAFTTGASGSDALLIWTAVPEPTAVALGIFGLAVLMAQGRRRQG